MPSQDDTEEALRGRLRELFGALQSTLQSMDDGSGELDGSAAVLYVLKDHLQPALDQEVRDAVASGASAWHLAHMVADVIDSVAMPTGRGTPFQPVREANKKLKAALAAAKKGREGERGERDEIEALVRRVIPGVLTPLEAMMAAHHDQTLGKLGEVEAVAGSVVPAVLTPLEVTLAAQRGETLGKLGDVQAAVGSVVPGVLVPLNTALAAQHGETLGKLATLDDETGELEDLIKGLPQKLAEVLLKNLPDIVRNVVIAIKAPITLPPPVITAVRFATLDDLAKAQAGDYTKTSADRLGLLQGALEVLTREGPVPPALIAPIDNLIVAVLNFSDPANPLTIAELNVMNTLKNQISPFLQSPVLPGVK